MVRFKVVLISILAEFTFKNNKYVYHVNMYFRLTFQFYIYVFEKEQNINLQFLIGRYL